jgi:hypothetical protein
MEREETQDNPIDKGREIAMARRTMDWLCFGGAAFWSVTWLLVWFATKEPPVVLLAVAFAGGHIASGVYWRFKMLRGSQDVIYRRLEAEGRKQQENAIVVLHVNGWLLLVASPVMALVAIACSLETYGWAGAIGGLVLGAFLCLAAIGMLHWGRVKRARFLDSNNP